MRIMQKKNNTSLLIVLFLIPQVTIPCTLILIKFFSLSAFVSCSFCSFLRFSHCLVDIAMRLSALCAVLSLLVVFFLIPEVTSCDVKVNGCSIPGDLSFFYKTTFRLACNKHDVCYYCVRLIFFLKKGLLQMYEDKDSLSTPVYTNWGYVVVNRLLSCQLIYVGL